ncbi:PEGA domain-containing protein [Vulgatibacter incomptus]|nr:PEGA domain-containing protein [Vulgatibacter incomptus]
MFASVLTALLVASAALAPAEEASSPTEVAPVPVEAVVPEDAAPGAAASLSSEAVPPPAEAVTEKTLWLVRSTYPGQELLVPRVEEAIARLVVGGDGQRELVGSQALPAGPKSGDAAFACAFGERGCVETMGSLAEGAGASRIVLVEVGQDWAGYRCRIASFHAGSTEIATAELESVSLDKALVGAILRVVPVAATLDLRSDPSGAAVLVDGEKVGVTPLSMQVFPGERTVRLELATYEAYETRQTVSANSRVALAPTLAMLPGRLRVVSAGATILVDDVEAGTDEVEVGAAAGRHSVRLVRDDFVPYETRVEVKPGELARVDHALEPTSWGSVTQAMSAAQEDIYSRRVYLTVVYDNARLTGGRFAAQSVHALQTKLDGLQSPSPSGAYVHSLGLEFGAAWRYFGMLWIGGSYFQSANPWTMTLTNGDADSFDGTVMGGTLRLLQPQLRVAIWRVVLGVRGGVLGRLGEVKGAHEDTYFAFVDFAGELQGSLRVHLVEGLYLEGGYGRTWTIVGSIDGTQELRGGVGYAF